MNESERLVILNFYYFMNYKFDDQEIDQESIKKMIIEIIKNEPTITRNGMANKLNISSTRIKHYLDKMRNNGLIVHKGSTKSGYWEILDKNIIQ